MKAPPLRAQRFCHELEAADADEFFPVDLLVTGEAAVGGGCSDAASFRARGPEALEAVRQARELQN